MTQEKTEAPTPHKLKKAREEGDAPQAKDFVTTSVTVLGFAIILAFGGLFGAQLIAFTRRTLQGGFAPEFQTALAGAAADAATVFVTLLAPFAISALVAAPLATLIGQGGITLAKYKLKFDAFSPAKNLQQRFSKQNLIEFLKALLRFTVIIAIFIIVLREGLAVLFLTVFCTLDCSAAVARDMATFFVALVFGVMFVLAFLDLLIQRALWTQKQKMTPEELKREHKELDGDPILKSARKSLAKRLTATTLEEAVSYSAIMFVDGSGRAVGVYHSLEREDPEVVVTLGGAGSLAEALVARANADGAPVVADPRLVAAFIGLSGMQPVADAELKAAVTRRLIAAGVAF